MKSFLYGFCNLMGTRLELPYLGESGKYLLGGFTACAFAAAVIAFACCAVGKLLADIMLGKFVM